MPARSNHPTGERANIVPADLGAPDLDRYYRHTDASSIVELVISMVSVDPMDPAVGCAG